MLTSSFGDGAGAGDPALEGVLGVGGFARG